MPFLFVDYDQGAGGEYLCFALSCAPECANLEQLRYNKRTKINDIFAQEFLKPEPRIVELPSPTDHYEVVPTHRHTGLAATLLDDVRSIRIHSPRDEQLWKYQKQLQIDKTMLTHEPNDAMFFGYVRILAKQSTNKDFTRLVRRHMDNLQLILLSQGLDNTESNRTAYLEYARSARVPEPDYDYDCIIYYEDLIFNPKLVVDQIKNCFNISVDLSLIEKYGHDYINTKT